MFLGRGFVLGLVGIVGCFSACLAPRGAARAVQATLLVQKPKVRGLARGSLLQNTVVKLGARELTHQKRSFFTDYSGVLHYDIALQKACCNVGGDLLVPGDAWHLKSAKLGLRQFFRLDQALEGSDIFTALVLDGDFDEVLFNAVAYQQPKFLTEAILFKESDGKVFSFDPANLHGEVWQHWYQLEFDRRSLGTVYQDCAEAKCLHPNILPVKELALVLLSRVFCYERAVWEVRNFKAELGSHSDLRGRMMQELLSVLQDIMAVAVQGDEKLGRPLAEAFDLLMSTWGKKGLPSQKHLLLYQASLNLCRRHLAKQ